MRGFFDDPMFRYLFPDHESRLEIMTAFFPPLVHDGIKRGQVIISAKREGACIFYPSDIPVFGEQFLETFTEITSIISTIAGMEALERLQLLAEKVEESEPHEPHCEVFWIAVIPEEQCKGIGGHLLQPVLDRADKHNVGCYVVSSNPRNIPFYERHTFQKISSIKVSDTYSMTCMWRLPDDL